MSDGLLPPYGAPPGPAASERAVLQAFAVGGAVGHSRRLHAEGAALYLDRSSVLALRLRGAVLVRADLPPEDSPPLDGLARALARVGFRCLDEGTRLGVPVALQLVGLRLSEWDLWGADIDDAFSALRSAAIGDAPMDD